MAAFIVTGRLKAQLLSVAPKAEAGAYGDENTLQLTEKEDIYTHTTTERVYSPESSDDDSDDSTSVDSDGFSGSDDDF